MRNGGGGGLKIPLHPPTPSPLPHTLLTRETEREDRDLIQKLDNKTNPYAEITER